MRYLLDTHAFLWCFEGSGKLSKTAKDILLDAETPKFISIASLWEFSVKHSMGKLPFDGGLSYLCNLIEQYDFVLLPILQSHLSAVIGLPFIHRDPYDRLLVATAKTDGLTILTADENIKKYDVLSAW
jgi:PIN domain nuclease of toxin-antitoxin system